MLHTMRHQLSKTVVYTIITLLILSFAAWGIHGMNSRSSMSSDVIQYHQTQIPKSAFLYQAHIRLQHLPPDVVQKIRNDKSVQILFNKKILDDLAQNIALKHHLDRSGYRLSPRLVKAAIANDPQFNVKHTFSAQRMRAYLQRFQLNDQQYFNLKQREMLFNMLSQWLGQSQPRLDNLMQQWQARDQQTRIVDVYRIEKPKHVSLSAARVHQYFKAHQESFRTKDRVDLSYIVLAMSDVASQIQPSREALSAFYSRHLGWYRKPSSYRIRQYQLKPNKKGLAKSSSLFKKIQINGASKPLPLWVKAHSLVAAHAPQTLVEAAITPAVARVLKATPVGHISDVMPSPDGPLVFEVLAHHPATQLAYHDVAKRVRKDFINHHAQRQFFDKLETMKDLAFNHPQSLQPISKALHVKINSISVTHHQPSKVKVLNHSEIRDFIFSSHIKSGINSKVFKVDQGHFVVLQVTKHHKGRIPDISEVLEKVRLLLSEQEAKRQQLATAKELMEKLGNNKSMGTLPKFVFVRHAVAFHFDPSADDKDPLKHLKKNFVAQLSFYRSHGVGKFSQPAKPIYIFKLQKIKPADRKKQPNKSDMGINAFVDGILYRRGVRHPGSQ